MTRKELSDIISSSLPSKEISRVVNERIEEIGAFFSPSLTYILYYGLEIPVIGQSTRIVLDSSSRKILETRVKEIEEKYIEIMRQGNVGEVIDYISGENDVFPKGKRIHTLFDPNETEILARRSAFKKNRKSKRLLQESQDLAEIKFEKRFLSHEEIRREFDRYFAIRDKDDVRQWLSEFYNVDDALGRMLKGSYVPLGNQSVYFSLNREKGYIDSFRLKLVDSYKKKLVRRWNDKLDDTDRKRFEEFIFENIMTDTDHWDPRPYLRKKRTYFLKKYGKNLCKMMIEDIFAARRVYLFQEKAYDELSRIHASRHSMNLPKGYKMTPDGYDDHRGRLIKRLEGSGELGRPGGIHLSIVDYENTNFVIELQFLDILSSVIKEVGYNADHRKEKNLDIGRYLIE